MPESSPDFGLRTDFYTFAPDALAKDLPDFEILREVGKGSMGIVYEARRRADGERVALKVLPPSLTLTERALARFLREAELMQRVRHPAIVRALDHGRQGRLHYFVMEYVDGRTLEERVRVGPLPARRVAEIGAEVARALQFAHDRGVVHRDVKPGNLIECEDDRVVITDFGLARETGTGSMTESGAIVGTPMYMAPEQVYGERDVVGTRTDVYGLGATLYELATGRSPFAGPTAQSVLKAVLEQDPAPPRRLRADLPAALEAVILAAMEKEPARRYGSAEEMAEDLERFLAGERVLARRPGPVRMLARGIARHRLATLLMLVIFVLGAGSYALYRDHRRRSLESDLHRAENKLALAASSQARVPGRPTLSHDERNALTDEAIGIATTVLIADSSYAKAWFVRAQAWHRLANYEESLSDLDFAAKLAGVGSELLNYRVDCLRNLADSSADAQARLQLDLVKLLDLEPSAATRCLVAEILLDLVPRVPSDAADDLLRRAAAILVDLAEDEPRRAIALARLHEGRGERSQAITAMRNARQMFAGNAQVHRAASHLFARLGLDDESRDAARAARTLGAPSPTEPGQPGRDVDVQEVEGFLQKLDALLDAARRDGG